MSIEIASISIRIAGIHTPGLKLQLQLHGVAILIRIIRIYCGAIATSTGAIVTSIAAVAT